MLWLSACGFLALAGAVAWFVLKPYLDVRAACRHREDGATGWEIIEQLRGPRIAARKLILFARLASIFSRDRQRQQIAIYLMGCCGSEAIPHLLGWLTKGDPKTRVSAADALGVTKDQRAVEPLLAVIGDPDADMRLWATMSLRKLVVLVEPVRTLYSGPIAEAGIVTLDNDPASWVRVEAAALLGETRDPRAVEPLIVALGNEDRAVRWCAAEALGKVGDRRAVKPLIPVLGDAEPGVRKWAAHALGKLGDTQALPALEALAASETDADVVEAARRAIEQLRTGKGTCKEERP